MIGVQREGEIDRARRRPPARLPLPQRHGRAARAAFLNRLLDIEINEREDRAIVAPPSS